VTLEGNFTRAHEREESLIFTNPIVYLNAIMQTCNNITEMHYVTIYHPFNEEIEYIRIDEVKVLLRD